MMLTRIRCLAYAGVVSAALTAAGCVTATAAGGGSLEGRYQKLVEQALETTPPQPETTAMAQLAEDAVTAARGRADVVDQMRAYGVMARAVLWAAADEALAASAREWLLEGRRVCGLEGVAESTPRECGVLEVALGVLEGEQALANLADAPRGTEPWRGPAADKAAAAAAAFLAGAADAWGPSTRRLTALEDAVDEDLPRWYALTATTQFCVLRNRVGLGVVEASTAFFPLTGDDAERAAAVTRHYREIRADAAAIDGWWALEPAQAEAAADWGAPAQDAVFEAYANIRCSLLFEERGVSLTGD